MATLRPTTHSAAITALALAVLAAPLTADDSITMTIPERMGDTPILSVRLLLDVSPAGGSAPTFTLTNPGDGATFDVTAEGLVCDDPACPSGEDVLIYDSIDTPDLGLAASPGDPYRHQFNIVLDSNKDVGADPTNPACDNDLAADETWTVTVNGAFEVDGACILSFTPDASCASMPLASGDPATITDDDGNPFAGLCDDLRPALDAMLVLDRSGSMGSPAISGGEVKIDILHDAVRGFVDVWEALRGSESGSASDTLGVVSFSGDADVWQAKGAFDAVKDTIRDDIDDPTVGLSAGGLTSIGDGLCLSADELEAASIRRAMVLVSDGMETTSRYVDSHDGAGPVEVSSPCDGAPGAELPVPGDYQIYSITIGEAGTVGAEVNSNLADATGGFYQNTTQTADEDLLPFFLRALQNFLAFHTWQSVLLDGGETEGAPDVSAAVSAVASASFPVTSTVRALSINVFVDDEFQVLVTPPGGTAAVHNGFRHLDVPFQLGDLGGAGLAGDWQVRIVTGRPMPYSLAVFADDLGVEAEFEATFDDFDDSAIRVEARVEELGRPLTGIDAQSDGRISARLLQPEETVGDLVSGSNASADPPSGSELTAAQTKLQNTLLADPAALARSEQGLTLTDDGGPGDRVAGDGIHGALIPVDEYGHYDLVFTVEADTTGSGRVRREHHETVYARAIASPETTELTSSVDGTSLLLTLVPKTGAGHLLGPGWSSYFWAKTADNQTFRARDRLDGSYTFTVPFSGSRPEVSVHYVPDSVTIPEDADPADLPSPLDDSTVILTEGDSRPWSWSIHAGINDPQSPASSFVDGGVSFGLDLEYAFSSTFSLELYVGEDQFDGQPSGSDVDVLQATLSGKYYFNPGSNRLFATLGLGGYDFSPGSSELGFSVGVGGQFRLSQRTAVEARATYHRVSSSPDFEYLAALVGVKLFL